MENDVQIDLEGILKAVFLKTLGPGSQLNRFPIRRSGEAIGETRQPRENISSMTLIVSGAFFRNSCYQSSLARQIAIGNHAAPPQSP